MFCSMQPWGADHRICTIHRCLSPRPDNTPDTESPKFAPHIRYDALPPATNHSVPGHGCPALPFSGSSAGYSLCFPPLHWRRSRNVFGE